VPGPRATLPRGPLLRARALKSETTRPSIVWIAVAAAGGALLVGHALRYPPVGWSEGSWDLLGWPRPAKLASVARTLLWLGAINLAAWSSAAWLSRLPAPGRLADLHAPMRLALGFGVLAVGALGLAAAGALAQPAFAALLAAPCLAWIGLGLRRRGRRPALRMPERRAAWAALLLAGLLVRPFLDAFGPDPGWDALSYHLALPERYLFENGVVMTPFSHLSGYAMGTQMLYLLALGVDGVSLAVLLHFEFGLLLLATLWRLGRRFSLRAAALAPLLLLADPLFQQELGWAYADLPLAFYATLAAACFAAWLDDRDDPRPLVYAGLLCGLCGSTRYLGAVVPAALCALVWLPPGPRRFRQSLGACLRMGLVSAAVASPWLLRNALLTGNPVVPFLQSLFHAPGREYIDPLVLAQSTAWVRTIGMGRDLGALLALPWNLSMETIPGIYSGSFGFQVGPLYAVGALAALALRDLRRDRFARTLLLLIGIHTAIWFYTLQEPRFLMPAFALMALAGGLAFDRLSRQGRFGRAILALPLLAALYTQALRLPSLPEDYAIALGGAPGDYYERHGPAQRAAAVLRDEGRPDAGVLLLFEQRGFLFRGLRYVPYHGSSGSPVLLLIHRAPDLAALRCRLQDMGITHVFVNRKLRRAQPVFLPGYSQADYAGDLRRIEELLRQGERRFDAEGALLVELAPARCGAPARAGG